MTRVKGSFRCAAVRRNRELDYEQYVSLLCGLPFDVPMILHVLSEEQVDATGTSRKTSELTTSRRNQRWT